MNKRHLLTAAVALVLVLAPAGLVMAQSGNNTTADGNATDGNGTTNETEPFNGTDDDNATEEENATDDEADTGSGDIDITQIAEIRSQQQIDVDVFIDAERPQDQASGNDVVVQNIQVNKDREFNTSMIVSSGGPGGPHPSCSAGTLLLFDVDREDLKLGARGGGQGEIAPAQIGDAGPDAPDIEPDADQSVEQSIEVEIDGVQADRADTVIEVQQTAEQSSDQSVVQNDTDEDDSDLPPSNQTDDGFGNETGDDANQTGNETGDEPQRGPPADRPPDNRPPANRPPADRGAGQVQFVAVDNPDEGVVHVLVFVPDTCQDRKLTISSNAQGAPTPGIGVAAVAAALAGVAVIAARRRG